MSPALIKALDHPLRRETLRLLAEQDKELSPVAIGKLVHASLSNLSYHVKVLADLSVIHKTRTRQVRGATEHLYVSSVIGSWLATAILESTRDDDKKIRR